MSVDEHSAFISGLLRGEVTMDVPAPVASVSMIADLMKGGFSPTLEEEEADAEEDPWRTLERLWKESMSSHSQLVRHKGRTTEARFATEDEPMQLLVRYPDLITLSHFSPDIRSRLNKRSRFQECLWHCKHIKGKGKRSPSLWAHPPEPPVGHVPAHVTGLRVLHDSVSPLMGSHQWEKLKHHTQKWISIQVSGTSVWEQIPGGLVPAGLQLVLAAIPNCTNDLPVPFRVELWKISGSNLETRLWCDKDDGPSVILTPKKGPVEQPILYYNELQTCCRGPALREMGMVLSDSALMKGSRARLDLDKRWMYIPTSLQRTTQSLLDTMLRSVVPREPELYATRDPTGWSPAELGQIQALYPGSKGIDRVLVKSEDGAGVEWKLPAVEVRQAIHSFLNQDHGLETCKINPEDELELRLFPASDELVTGPWPGGFSCELTLWVRYLYHAASSPSSSRPEFLRLQTGSAVAGGVQKKRERKTKKMESDEEEEEAEEEEDSEEEEQEAESEDEEQETEAAEKEEAAESEEEEEEEEQQAEEGEEQEAEEEEDEAEAEEEEAEAEEEEEQEAEEEEAEAEEEEEQEAEEEEVEAEEAEEEQDGDQDEDEEEDA